MIDKTCVCGCGRKWRGLKDSPSKYFSNAECPDFEQLKKEFKFGDVFKMRKFTA